MKIFTNFRTMNTEQKAKAYDEALERMKSWARGEHPECFTEAQKTAEFIFPELKESEDERIKKTLIDYFQTYKEQEECGIKTFFGIPTDNILAWLEKQGEQKLADKVIKPKFHEGEWVVFNNRHDSVYRVEKIENYEYTLRHFLGGSMPLSFSHEDMIRAWTIQDAKDGDVLSDGTTIFIFKDLLSDGSVMSYCDYDTDSGDSDAFCPLSVNLMCSKITPTTKEQCDLLFQKMHEARYMWDSEKKELKNIEQNSAWSEEDDYNVQCLVAKVVSDIQNGNVGRNQELIDWLKSLKNRYTWKPSDEQMNALKQVYDWYNTHSAQSLALNSLYNDLKKLKGK